MAQLRVFIAFIIIFFPVDGTAKGMYSIRNYIFPVDGTAKGFLSICNDIFPADGTTKGIAL